MNSLSELRIRSKGNERLNLNKSIVFEKRLAYPEHEQKSGQDSFCFRRGIMSRSSSKETSMGLMDMFGKKSPLVDCQTYLSNITGKLSGSPQMTTEGDFSVWFIPDNKQYLLNRNKVKNSNDMM